MNVCLNVCLYIVYKYIAIYKNLTRATIIRILMYKYTQAYININTYNVAGTHLDTL